MSIFTIIHKWFHKNNANQKSGNSINIKISEDGFFDIFYNIEHGRESDIDAFTTLLFKMNSGKLYDDFIEQLLNHAKEKENHTSFILKVIYSWGSMIKQNKNTSIEKDEPVVRPTKVFSSGVLK